MIRTLETHLTIDLNGGLGYDVDNLNNILL